MVNVKGRWALVTGASRGLGHLAAEFLAERGCNLVLQSRDTSHTNEFEQSLKDRFGIEVFSVSAELLLKEDILRMLKEIDEKGITIDIVLNNAGVQVAYRTDYFLTPTEDYEKSFQVNTIAPMMICYHYLPKMIENSFGRIVNTTSGIRLEPEQAGYSASKAALDKVTIDIGSKIDGTNVMINLTDPGWCKTDLGGSNAPNSPESALPGVVVGVFADDKKSGRLFTASDFNGMTIEQAVEKAELMPSPY